ncbi:MAG: response regulator [Desulfobacteraceae bacterium]|nr:response regulator [Pseudomonadota bacterium]MBU4463113.1 response regulator [Pseudomonadota bacterium]MCG2754208.1 response regulator [Desulfobacteraceae bacterium]
MDILFIDDDFVGAGVVIRSIEQFVSNIETAVTAEDALIKVRLRDFDLVLFNISSTGFDCCELIRQLKSICPDIKIVTLTNQNSRELELKIRKLGVIFYMIKPFKIKVLKDILEYISKSKEKLRIEKLRKFHHEWTKL